MPSATEGEVARRRLAPRHRDVRVADLLIDQLVKAGVEVVFGLPGGAISTLHDALLDRPEIRVITTRHESGAMFAAAAYARVTGKLAPVLVTSGPGVLNCMTGLATAHCDSVPLLLLAGEVPRRLFGRRALQEGSANHLNVIAMAKPITKMAFELTSADSAPAALKRAMTTALSGRPGPVLLTLPLDVSGGRARRPGIVSNVELHYRIDEDVLAKVAGTLESAERPVIFAGSGARWRRGPEELVLIAERLGVPVMTTPKGKGVFPESHPLSLGVFGHGGHPSATAYLEQGIDILFAIGTGFSDPATNGWSDLLRPTEHLIQIDADVLQMGTSYPVSLGLVGAADEILRRIRERVSAVPREIRQYGPSWHTDPEVLAVGSEGLISPQRALWELQRAMPPSAAFACDIGEHLLFATHYLKIDDPQGFLIMTGLASMGSSIAGAIGMKLGMPERAAVAICGDGCFAMALGDLATACRERIPIVVCVINDQRYGMVELGHEQLYGRRPSYPCTEIDVGALAKSLGASAVRIERPGDMDGIRAPDIGLPLVLDVRIDRSVRMPKDRRTAQLGQGMGVHVGERK